MKRITLFVDIFEGNDDTIDKSKVIRDFDTIWLPILNFSHNFMSDQTIFSH